MRTSHLLSLMVASTLHAHPGHEHVEFYPQNAQIAHISLSSPLAEGMPEELSVSVICGDDYCTLDLRQSPVISENFCIRLDHGDGTFTEHPCDGEVHTYTGTVSSSPGSKVCAWVCDLGVNATITRPNGTHWEILAPLTPDGEHLAIERKAEPTANPLDALTEDQRQLLAQLNNPNSLVQAFALPRQVTVKRAEIGFDVSNRTFREAFNGNQNATDFSANSDYGRGFSNNADLANRFIQSFVNQTNQVFIRDNLVKLEIGVINIRTNAATDPYEGRIVDNETLNLFRDIWNGSNTSSGPRPSSTHHLAHAMIGGGGDSASGLSWVGQINENLRYSIGSTNSGSGLNFWKGVALHEIVHTWGGSHGDGANYDLNTSGVPFSIGMIAGDRSRTNAIEHSKIISERDSSNLPDIGAIPEDEENVRPYCLLDNFTVSTNDGPVLLDILANDFDANNTPFMLESFILMSEGGQPQVMNATTSRQGATLEISDGTGPGGRDQLLYTPPSSATGQERIHYRVFDQTGKASIGNIVIEFANMEPGVTLAQRQLAGLSTSPIATFVEGLHRSTDLNASDVPENEASSIYIPLNYRARLFLSNSLQLNEGHADLGAGSFNLNGVRFLDSSGTDIGLHADQRVSAMQVFFTGPSRPHVELYHGSNFIGSPGIFNGEEEGVSNGVYRRNRLDWPLIGNNAASSIRIPPGYTVTLYDHDPPSGSSVTLKESLPDLSSVGFNDRTSSMVITYEDPGDYVSIYPGADYEGREGWLTPGAYPLTRLEKIAIRNDSITSLRIPTGWTVTLFEDDQFSGEQLTLSEDENDLGSFANRVSSILVVDRDLDTTSQPGITLFSRQLSGINTAFDEILPPALYRSTQLNETTIPSNTASSMYVPLNFQVRLFDSNSLFTSDGHADRGPGAYNLNEVRFLDETGADIGRHADQRVSALNVAFNGPDRPHVQIYRNSGFIGFSGIFNGEEPEVTNGVYRASHLNLTRVNHNGTSSIRIPPGYTVKLYDHDPPSGDFVELTESQPDLGTLDFNNRTSSMVITYEAPGDYVSIFGIENYEGREGWLMVGDYPLSRLEQMGIRDDGVASLRVPGGWKVTLFENDQFSGPSLEITADTPDLGNFVDRTSSIRVALLDPDSDSDFLPDEWELTHFGNLSENLEGDFDLDGHPNFLEYYVGSNPAEKGGPFARFITTNDNKIALEITRSRHIDTSQFQVVAQSSTDLETWTDLAISPLLIGVTDDQFTLRYVHPNSFTNGGKEYFRLEVSFIGDQ